MDYEANRAGTMLNGYQQAAGALWERVEGKSRTSILKCLAKSVTVYEGVAGEVWQTYQLDIRRFWAQGKKESKTNNMILKHTLAQRAK